MEFKYFPQADILTIMMDNEEPYLRTEDTDYVITDYSENGQICRIQFVDASLGINPENVPEEAKVEFDKYIKENELIKTPLHEWVYN